MIGRMARAVAALALVLAGTNSILGLRPARADSVADFYKGRTVEVYVGYSTGGGYDIYARMLVRHLGRFIPGNPTLVAKNMEGAGSLRLANWLANAAPRNSVRHDRSRHRLRSGARPAGRAVQGAGPELDRQHEPRGEHLRGLARRGDRHVRGPQDQDALDRRRERQNPRAAPSANDPRSGNTHPRNGIHFANRSVEARRRPHPWNRSAGCGRLGKDRMALRQGEQSIEVR